jgi:hypothetical protein
MRRAILLVLLPLLAGSSEINRPNLTEQKRFRLELHVPDQSGIYFTAWGDGDVITDHDASDKRVVTYERRLIWYDDCEWVATEKLTPTAPDRYDYEYRETPVACPKGRQPNGTTTPRDGKVTVHPADDNKPLTPLIAWARGWDKPGGGP